METAALEWRWLLPHWLKNDYYIMNVDHCYGMRKTVCLVTRETLYLVWSLGRCLVLFGYSGDALSGLVTRETPYLVWTLGRRLVWFDTLGWCQRLRDDNFQNIVWFQLLGRRCLIWPTRETRCPGDITRETQSDLDLVIQNIHSNKIFIFLKSRIFIQA